MSARDPIAIVGYAYRMPRRHPSNDDFWRVLRDREVVREPVAALRSGLPPDQRVLRAGSLRECLRGLIRDRRRSRSRRRFSATTYAYTANVPDDRSGVKVNGTSVTSGSLSGEIAVAIGANRVGVPL